MSLQKRNNVLKSSLSELHKLRIKDIELFLSLSQTLNIRELSRKMDLTPGQISKTIHKFEKALNIKVFNRSTVGLSLTTEGQSLYPKIKRIYKNLIDLSEVSFEEQRTKLTIASSSFLVSHLIPQTVPKFTKEQFNIIELPPEDYIQVGLRSGFSICVHTKLLDWPQTWHSQEVGEIHYNLYAHKKHPFFEKTRISQKDLEQATFITPTYWTREGIKTGDDQFPKKIKRISWHKTSTALSAASIINQSEHIGFLPSLITKHLPNVKRMKTSLVPSVSSKVYVTVKSDEVSQIFYNKFIEELSKALKK